MEKEKIVLKWGSDSITNEFGMDEDLLNDATRNIDQVRDRYDVVVVSSGAVAVGKSIWIQSQAEETDIHNNPEPSLQAFAMMGIPLWSTAWQKALSKFDIPSGQLLVTHNEIDDPIDRPVLEEALQDCFRHGIVPVVNENDPVSTVELAKLAYGGDNDGIAGHIAHLISAEILIIYTEKGGLINEYDQEVPILTPSNYGWAKKMVNSRERREDPHKKGRGGMSSKLHVCHKYSSLGIRTFIAKQGTEIDDVLNGNSGTEVIAIEA